MLTLRLVEWTRRKDQCYMTIQQRDKQPINLTLIPSLLQAAQRHRPPRWLNVSTVIISQSIQIQVNRACVFAVA